MSILGTIKEALHIGQDVAEVSDGRLKVGEAETLSDVEEKHRPISDYNIEPPKGVAVDVTHQEVDIDFWVKKTKAELYKIGAANEVVEANNEENEKVVSVKVPKKYLEASAVALNNLFGDDKYYDLSTL